MQYININEALNPGKLNRIKKKLEVEMRQMKTRSGTDSEKLNRMIIARDALDEIANNPDILNIRVSGVNNKFLNMLRQEKISLRTEVFKSEPDIETIASKYLRVKSLMRLTQDRSTYDTQQAPQIKESEFSDDLKAMYGKAWEVNNDSEEKEYTEKELEESNLFYNIRAKQKRIAKGSGERMKKPGEKGYPKHLEKIAKEANENMKYTLKSPELLESLLSEKLAMPKKGEGKNDFISRFMSSELAKKEFPENKQRVAVAYSQWQREHKDLKEATFKVSLVNQGDTPSIGTVEADTEDEAITKAIDAFDVDVDNIESIEKVLEEEFFEFLKEEMINDKDFFSSLNESDSLNEGKILDWVRWKLAKFSLNFLSNNSLNDLLEAYYSNKEGNPTKESKAVSKMKRGEKIKKVKELAEKLPKENKDKIVNSSQAKQLESQATKNLLIASAAGVSTIFSRNLARDTAIQSDRVNKVADSDGTFGVSRSSTGGTAGYEFTERGAPATNPDWISNDRGGYTWVGGPDKNQFLNVNVKPIDRNNDISGYAPGVDGTGRVTQSYAAMNTFSTVSNLLSVFSSILFGAIWGAVILAGVNTALGLRKFVKATTIRKNDIIDQIKSKNVRESFKINFGSKLKPLNEAKQKHPMIIKYGVEGFNKPKATPSHKTKSHLVVAKKGEDVKVVRFGAQGVKGSPKKDGESEAYRKRREGFVARHKAQNPEGMKDKFSPLYWANRIKW
jgi:hypothetical protein